MKKGVTFKRMTLTSILSLALSLSGFVFAQTEHFTTIELDGTPIQIHYFHTLPANPSLPFQTLIFFHGQTVSHEIWKPVLEILNDLTNADSYALTFPGYGKSDTPAPGSFDYTETGLNRVPFKFADKLGIQRFIPVVHDLGGAWTLCPATEQISRLDGLITMNTPPPSSPDVQFYPAPGIRLLGKLMANPRISTRALQGYMTELLQAATTQDIVAKFPTIVNKILTDNSDTPHRLAISTIIQKALDNPLGFGGICYPNIPTLNSLEPLLVWGMDDPVEGITVLRIYQEAWPGAQTVAVSGASHYVMLDQEQIVAEVIANYVNQRLALPSSAPTIRPSRKLPIVWAEIKSSRLDTH